MIINVQIPENKTENSENEINISEILNSEKICLKTN